MILPCHQGTHNLVGIQTKEVRYQAEGECTVCLLGSTEKGVMDFN